MFTSDPEQSKKWGFDAANAVTSEEVAAAMMDLVVNDHPGGTCLEVSKAGTRELGVWNIPAPTMVGTGVAADLSDNYARLTEIMDTERRGAKL
jgi:hypothetical protein